MGVVVKIFQIVIFLVLQEKCGYNLVVMRGEWNEFLWVVDIEYKSRIYK